VPLLLAVLGKRGISKEMAKKLAHVLNAPIARFI
jgi:hypothetical protein